jgi:hypothetical protein
MEWFRAFREHSVNDQYQYRPQSQTQSGGGCGRVLILAGGCLVVVLIASVAVILAAGLIWDRGSEAGINWATNWAVDRASSDIGDRIGDDGEASDGDREPRQIDDRDEYLDALETYNQEFLTAMEEIARLLSNPHLQDDDWSEAVAGQIREIRRIEADARAISPPPGMDQVHDAWVESLGESRRAMDLAAGALDELSPTRLVEALEAMDQATRSYESMVDSLNEPDE